jgi:hypothetical protein
MKTKKSQHQAKSRKLCFAFVPQQRRTHKEKKKKEQRRRDGDKTEMFNAQ